MAQRTIVQLEGEMRAESLRDAPDDAKLYALQAERDELREEDHA